MNTRMLKAQLKQLARTVKYADKQIAYNTDDATYFAETAATNPRDAKRLAQCNLRTECANAQIDLALVEAKSIRRALAAIR